jgi:NADPH:quinone reductase-like Zn-dependent oxidoreductase
VDKPTIRDDEVLVRVRAASVDRGTWHLMAGLPYPIRVAGSGLRKPKYLNPGRSLAGTVEATGNDVTGFQPGDEVFGIGGECATSCQRGHVAAPPKPARGLVLASRHADGSGHLLSPDAAHNEEVELAEPDIQNWLQCVQGFPESGRA